jgi:YHS domain-containing protein
MNKSSESESSYTQTNMSKDAPSQGASAQHWQSSNGQAQSWSAQQDDNPTSSQASSTSSESDEQFDPVCGMAVDVNDEMVERYEQNGKTYYFCSSDCREQFHASPEEFEI